jgi:hypothetical protein
LILQSQSNQSRETMNHNSLCNSLSERLISFSQKISPLSIACESSFFVGIFFGLCSSISQIRR